MSKIEYSTGLWSERTGAKLVWGRGERSKAYVCGPDDKIEPVAPAYWPMIRKAGYDPAECVSVGTEIMSRLLIPEIEACIRSAAEARDEKRAEDHAELDRDIASGVAFRTVEVADQYGCELMWARRLRDDEKSGFAEWCRDRIMRGYAASGRIKVEGSAVRVVLAGRAADGMFAGCTNEAWIITQAEWDQIVALSVEAEAKKAAAVQAIAEAKTADIRRKIETGYCFACESWCHGDCGHYSKDPNTRYLRQAGEAVREGQYGIHD